MLPAANSVVLCTNDVALRAKLCYNIRIEYLNKLLSTVFADIIRCPIFSPAWQATENDGQLYQNALHLWYNKNKVVIE